MHHFRRNRHFPKGPFAISFEFLFVVWRFWRLIAISAIFANACISGHISTHQPTHCRATSSGFLILRTAFTSTGSGFRPFVRQWPMNCTSLHLNVNCFLLSLMLRWLHQSIFICLMLCFSLTSDQYIASYFEDSVQSSKVLVKFHLKNFQG